MAYIKDSTPDLKFVQTVRADGILGDVDPARLRKFVLGPTFLIACGDCMRRFWEAMGHISRITSIPIEEFGFQLCVHNGAPLYLTQPDSPEFSIIMKHYREAKSLGNAGMVMGMGHGPCGAAGLMKLSLAENLERTLCAGLEAPDIFDLDEGKCLTLFHVDEAEDKKRLYHGDLRRWVRSSGGIRASV